MYGKAGITWGHIGRSLHQMDDFAVDAMLVQLLLVVQNPSAVNQTLPVGGHANSLRNVRLELGNGDVIIQTVEFVVLRV